MNDMLTDTMSDDAVIARLRSALDEVATTGGPITADAPDEFDASVVPLRTASPGRRPTRTWLGVAAASVVLLGAAGFALTQRTSPASSGEATTAPTDPTSTLSASTVADPTAANGTGPTYEVRLDDAGLSEITTNTTDDPGGFTQTWWVNDPGDSSQDRRGFLVVRVTYEQLDLPPDPAASTLVEGAPQGTAWFLGNADSTSADTTLQLVWQRTDGTVWQASQVGLADAAAGGPTAFANEVFQLQTSTFNDLLTSTDPFDEWLGVAAGPQVETSQKYTIGGDTNLALSVINQPTASALIGSLAYSEITVAGSRGWRAFMPDGEIRVAWVAENGWWGLMRIGPALATRADEIIGAVTLVDNGTTTPTDAPTNPTAPATTAAMGELPTKPADAPSFVLDSPVLAPAGTDGVTQVGSGDTVLRGAVWTVDQTDVGGSLGSVFATAFDWGGMPYQVDGVTYLDVSRNGVEAVLYVGADDSSDPAADPQVYFPQADGVVWVFEAADLAATGNDPSTALVDLAFALSNDAFTTGADPSLASTLSQLGEGNLPTYEYFDTYSAPNSGTVTVAVSDGIAASALRDATDVTSATVLGRPTLVGTLPDGSTKMVWQLADDSPWWVSLTFSDAATAALANQVIAALRPA
jgi:hypothetical protein